MTTLGASVDFEVGVGVPPRPPRTLLDHVAEWAPRVGVSSLWTIDHFSSFVPASIWGPAFSPAATRSSSPDRIFEFQTVLGYLAARAPGLRLAVGVTEAIRRHPVVLAQTFLTLSHLSDVPVILGLGAGERENAEAYGFDFERPVSRLGEAVQLIRQCFAAQGPFSFEGSLFHLEDALLDLEAGPSGQPSIWLAAHGPRTLGLTGALADGWYPSSRFTPTEYADGLSAISDSAEGRNMAGFTPALQCMVALGETESLARARLESPPTRLWSLLTPGRRWAELGYEHPLGADFGGMVDFVPSEFGREAIQSALDAIPLGMLEQAVFWGTPDNVAAEIGELVDVGLRHPVVIPVPGLGVPSPDEPDSHYRVVRLLNKRYG